MRIFRNIKDIFYSLYWYRWRKSTKVEDLKFLLSNSWDMVDSSFDMLIAKTEQVMYYIRNHGHEVRRYIDTSNILSEATKSDQLYIANKIIDRTVRNVKEHLIKIPYKTVDDSESLSGKGTYYFKVKLDKNNNLLYSLIYEIAVKEKPFWKIPKHERYFYKTELIDGVRNAEKVKNIQYYYKCPAIIYTENSNNSQFDLIEKRLRECYNIPDLIERIISNESSFNLECEDLKQLSSGLLKYKRGAIYTYHEMWQFRKMLLDCKKYHYDWPNDYWKKYEDIKNDDAAIDALFKTYETKRKDVILKTFKFFIDHYRNWWD